MKLEPIFGPQAASNLLRNVWSSEGGWTETALTKRIHSEQVKWDKEKATSIPLPFKLKRQKKIIDMDVFKELSGKIVLVDHEGYEKRLLENALLERNWDIKVEYFKTGEEALKYLQNTKDELFLVISDMKMPGMTGLDLKKAIDGGAVRFREKLIPFVFVSKSATRKELTDAYEYRVQGYFKKPTEVDQQADILDKIIQYWIIARHPNKEDKDTKVSRSLSSAQAITKKHRERVG